MKMFGLRTALAAPAAMALQPALGSAPSLLHRALADPGRAAQRADDVRRHPADLVALADLKPAIRGRTGHFALKFRKGGR